MISVLVGLYLLQSPQLPPVACASYAQSEQGGRFQQPAFKGVELYGWMGLDGQCRYSLMWGTNRRKEKREIKAAACALPDLAAVKGALAHFAEGETVVWGNSPDREDGTCATREAIDTVSAHCIALGINFLAPEAGR